MRLGSVIGAFWSVMGALLPLLAGFGAAEWWEHRACGEPRWARVDVLFVHIAPPDGLAAQRDAARRRLALAEAGEARLEAGVRAQNAAARAIAASGQTAMIRAQSEVQRYRTQAVSAAERAGALGAPLTGATACERVTNADARLLEALR